MELTFFHLGAIAALAILVSLMYLVLFEPALAYRVDDYLPACDSAASRELIRALVDAPMNTAEELLVLTNGEAFYAAELAAMRGARTTVHLEAYVFHRSAIAERILQVLAERARAGVRVRLVIDAVGSLLTPDSYFDDLRRAGGQVRWYQPIRWHTLKRFNNRTHRELLIIDGEVAFVRGAGIAAWWDESNGPRAWRDTMVRVEGRVARALQSSFAENWLESSGQLLVDDGAFPRGTGDSGRPAAAYAIVVTSPPSAGRATRARMLFQLLVASARGTIHINSPYFLPDRSMIRALRDAACRGVCVDVIVPNHQNNHPMARRASRRRYGDLLDAGVRIHEYRPSMMHAKILVVDNVWSVVGSTNCDSRSFGLNDEVNLAVQGQAFAAELKRDFERDLTDSDTITKAVWRRRPISERALALLGRILERQQ